MCTNHFSVPLFVFLCFTACRMSVSVCFSVCPSVCFSMCPSACLYVSVSHGLCMSLFVSVFLCISAFLYALHLPDCLSVCLFTQMSDSSSLYPLTSLLSYHSSIV